MPLQALVDKVDCFELLRDQIGAILLTESASQAALAAAASPPKDPKLWRLRVFTERSNPIGEYLDLPDEPSTGLPLPIVNVWYNGTTFDPSASNVVERQKGTSTFYLDCYAVGWARNLPGGGHLASDEVAALEVQRVARLVRNWLMAADYTYLALPRGTVWKRWIGSLDVMVPAADEAAAQRIAAMRVQLQVDHSEYSPQYIGQPFEGVTINVKRAETGELYFKETILVTNGDTTP